MLHLRTIGLRATQEEERKQYPFNIPALPAGEEIEITAPVTFLVGENGSGKSTLLEARAVAYETLEHVTITRSFLSNPEQYLRHL